MTTPAHQILELEQQVCLSSILSILGKCSQVGESGQWQYCVGSRNMFGFLFDSDSSAASLWLRAQRSAVLKVQRSQSYWL